jgi:hypothetical protein
MPTPCRFYIRLSVDDYPPRHWVNRWTGFGITKRWRLRAFCSSSFADRSSRFFLNLNAGLALPLITTSHSHELTRTPPAVVESALLPVLCCCISPAGIYSYAHHTPESAAWRSDYRGFGGFHH